MLKFSNYFRIILDWIFFDLEYSKDCTSDYVMISEVEVEVDPDGPQTGVFEKLCGNFDKNITR